MKGANTSRLAFGVKLFSGVGAGFFGTGASVDVCREPGQIPGMNESSIEVHHNAGASRYECAVPGVAPLAVAEYVLEPDPSNDRGRNRMIFTHTFVPPEMRGKGIAEKLVRAALADARAHGRHVVAECSYVAQFIERHSAEYGDLLV